MEDDGRWNMENGRWKIEDDERRKKEEENDGRWKMMEDERWKMEDEVLPDFPRGTEWEVFMDNTWNIYFTLCLYLKLHPALGITNSPVKP